MSSTEQIADSVAAQYLTRTYGDDKLDFQIYSAVRFDPNLYDKSDKIPLSEAIDAQLLDSSFFFLFSGHIKRLNNTVKYFDWVPESEKNKLIVTPEKLLTALTKFLKPYDRTKCYKIRLLLNKSLDIDCEVAEVPERDLMRAFSDPDTPFEHDVYVDPQQILVTPFTSFKTSVRDHYDDARKRCLPDIDVNPDQDVILHNTAGEVTESSICNVAFWRKSKPHPTTGLVKEGWVTPPLSTGCLCGTVRDYLVTNNHIDELSVPVKSIEDGETVLLFNGIRGVIKGKIDLKKFA